MTVREIISELWYDVYGGNANSNYEGWTSSNKNNHGHNNTTGGSSNCPPYMNPAFKDCLNGIIGGVIGGSAGGPGAAIASGIGAGIGACSPHNGGNAGSYGNDIGGQCTW